MQRAQPLSEIVDQLVQRIRAAAAQGTPLCVRGGGSKDFYGEAPRGEALNTGPYRGIIDYAPSELVVTARAGTPLAELEAVLAGEGQMLAFEPPHFGPATLGGCVAAGLSGPRRASAGAVRDFVLGVRLLDGMGNDLSFGGQVMKNVAGFDVSRLMAGALGTLGVLLEVSLKVLPLPKAQATLRFELSAADAIESMNRWAGSAHPISATRWNDGELLARLSGAGAAVEAAARALGGERVDEQHAAASWLAVREHSEPYFETQFPLWRLSVKSTSAMPDVPGAQLIEWGGALRWLATDADAHRVRAIASTCGGHATLFRASDKAAGVFAPLSPALMAIHRKLKRSLDPKGILNPGRMYPDL